MDFEMSEREDFGDWGDERFLGLCEEDWLEDRRFQRIELQRELAERKEQEELELEFHEDNDYLECEFED